MFQSKICMKARCKEKTNALLLMMYFYTSYNKIMFKRQGGSIQSPKTKQFHYSRSYLESK